MGRVIRRMALLICVLVFAKAAGAQNREQTDQEARAILKELVEINTTESAGSVTRAAEAMAKRLRDAGFPDKDIHVAGPDERKKTSLCALGERAKNRRSCLLGIWTLWKPGVKIGAWIHFSLSSRKEISTGEARET